MEEVYVMGHRLIVFLDHALPQHPEFWSADSKISLLRDKFREDLHWIHNRLEVVALRVDEEQMNQHILLDLEGGYEQLLMNHEPASPTLSEGKGVDSEWEHFSGWTAMVSEQDFAWEEAHDVSFESDEMQSTASFQYDPDVSMYEDVDSDDDLSIISWLDEESIGVSRRVAQDEGINAKNSRFVSNWTKGDRNNSVTRSPRLSPRKALSNLMTNVLKRPARQDPPGVYLSKINCFVTVQVRQYDDRLGIKDREDKENETISTAPSDEEDNYPLRRGRTRILDYSPPVNDSLEASN